MSSGRWLPALLKTIPSQAGKTIAITGTTSGVGKILAAEAARNGATVLLLNRESPRAVASLESLRADVPSGVFVAVECDLMSFESVRRAANDITGKHATIDVLCNNAGIMAQPDKATEDGYDIQMQVNCHSHFLLTHLLFPCLERAAVERGEARIVNHSSIARKDAKTGLKARYLEKNGGNLGGDGDKQKRYSQTKLANLVFTSALSQRLEAAGSKVLALTAHPGVSSTGLFHSGDLPWLVAKAVDWMAMAPADGAQGIVKACLATDVANGDFYGPTGMGGIRGAIAKIPLSPDEQSPEQTELYWTKSEEATGITFVVS